MRDVRIDLRPLARRCDRDVSLSMGILRHENGAFWALTPLLLCGIVRISSSLFADCLFCVCKVEVRAVGVQRTASRFRETLHENAIAKALAQ
jgi:hypothetical protein